MEAGPASVDPSAPSGQTPPYAKAKRARPGHPGRFRPAPTRIDRREKHSLEACPRCHGPVTPSRGSRTRFIEDIPDNITTVVTTPTIHRSWCSDCKTTVEPRRKGYPKPGIRSGLTSRAGEGIRTPDVQLGKLAFYH